MKILFLTIGLTGVAALAPAGCESQPKAAATDSTEEVASLADSLASMEEAGATTGSLSISDNGLEVRMWIVADDPTAIGAAFIGHAHAAAVDDMSLGNLARNGFRVQRVAVASLPAFLEALGGSSIDQRWWFGQVFDWRELFRRPLAARSQGVAIDGRVRSFADGAFSLLIRSWTVKTESGPRLQFDLVPYFVHGTGGPGIRRLVRDGEPAGEAFPTLHVAAQLEPGYGYVLTAEAPGVDWANVRKSESPRSAPDPDVRGTIGPPDLLGPQAAGPTTIGETMLRGSDDRSNRLIVVLIPRIPASFFPPELLPSAAVEGDESADEL